MARRVIVAALALAIGASVAGALLTAGSRSQTPVARLSDSIPQDAETVSRGIRIAADSAIVSGTETILHLRIDIVAASEAPEEIRSTQPRVMFPARDAFAGPFDGALVEVNATSDGRVSLRLAPLVVGPEYDGSISLTFGALIVDTEQGPVRVDGEWSLALEGPAPETLADALYVEELTAVAYEVEGDVIEVSGVRSRTATVVSVRLPPGLELPVPPTLEAAGEIVRHDRATNIPQGMTVGFPPTPFGSDVVVNLGSIAVSSEEPPVQVTIDVSRALARAAGAVDEFGDSQFAVRPEDVVAGDASLIVSGHSGVTNWNQRPWVGLTFEGTWPMETDPHVLGANGEVLNRARLTVGYSKDSSGQIQPGQTMLAASVDDPLNTPPLTFVLGPRVTMVDGDHRVLLRPE